jgi:myosin heavy subunit
MCEHGGGISERVVLGIIQGASEGPKGPPHFQHTSWPVRRVYVFPNARIAHPMTLHKFLTMAPINYAAAIVELRSQQESHPLSILQLAEPIVASTQNALSPSKRASDVSTSDIENPTPVSLEADLVHYKVGLLRNLHGPWEIFWSSIDLFRIQDLFSKLHFSYLEQVTKEKFLRSIVDDPPLFVSHAENVALETSLAQQKADLKAAKEEVNVLVQEMDLMARQLAARWEGVQAHMAELERLPAEIEGLDVVIGELRKQQHVREGQRNQSNNPRMNLSLTDTEEAIKQQKEKAAALDKQIMALQRQMQANTRECEMAEKDLETLEKRRSEVCAAANAARKIKDGGGKDELEEKGRWYRNAEMVLREVVGVDA